MEEYPNAYINLKHSSMFNTSQSSIGSRQLTSPRSRTIEELLRLKYTPTSKENSYTLTPAVRLEQVLAKSRFTKRSTDSEATPRFLPREVQVSIRELERKVREKEIITGKEENTQRSLQKNVPKQSLELIQRLREEVRNRAGFFEHEEPPDLLEMNVLDRNNYWLQVKKQKIEEKRKEIKDKELDGCTFRPVLNTQRLRTPISQRSKSPNTSYSMQYVRRKNARSNSTGKLSNRSTPKGISRDSSFAGGYLPAQLSPKNHQISYKSGFNVASFLGRAQPVVDYKYFK